MHYRADRHRTRAPINRRVFQAVGIALPSNWREHSA